MSKNRISIYILFPIIYFILGITFMVVKSKALDWLFTIVGILFIARGIYNLLWANKYHMSPYVAIINIIVGVIVILGGWLFVNIILLILGIFMIFDGLLGLYKMGKKVNVDLLLQSLISIIIGILLIVCKIQMLDAFFIVIGVMYLIKGIYALRYI